MYLIKTNGSHTQGFFATVSTKFQRCPSIQSRFQNRSVIEHRHQARSQEGKEGKMFKLFVKIRIVLL